MIFGLGLLGSAFTGVIGSAAKVAVPTAFGGLAIGSSIVRNNSTMLSEGFGGTIGSTIVRDETEDMSKKLVGDVVTSVVAYNQEKEINEIKENADRKIQWINNLVAQTNTAVSVKIKETNDINKYVYENALIPAANIIRQMNVYGVSGNNSIIDDVKLLDNFEISIEKCKIHAGFWGGLAMLCSATSPFSSMGFGAGYCFGLYSEKKKAESELVKIEIECEKAQIECTKRQNVVNTLDMTNKVVLQLNNLLAALYMNTEMVINTRGYNSYYWNENEKDLVRSFCNVAFALAEIVSTEVLTQSGDVQDRYVDIVNDKRKLLS